MLEALNTHISSQPNVIFKSLFTEEILMFIHVSFT